MAAETITLKLGWNRRRAAAIIEETRGQLKRARRRDRPAIFQRAVDRMVRECTRVGPPLATWIKPEGDLAWWGLDLAK